MEAPGYKKDDITISVDKGELTVTFEKNDEEEENKKYLHRERKSYSKVTRSFFLGDVNEDEIDANFKMVSYHLLALRKNKLKQRKQLASKNLNNKV